MFGRFFGAFGVTLMDAIETHAPLIAKADAIGGDCHFAGLNPHHRLSRSANAIPNNVASTETIPASCSEMVPGTGASIVSIP